MMYRTPLEIRHAMEMLELLRAFPLSDLKSLGRSVQRLEALFRYMETPDESWKQAFLSNWTILEEAYAIAVSTQPPMLDADSVVVAEKAVSALTGLLEALG